MFTLCYSYFEAFCNMLNIALNSLVAHATFTIGPYSPLGLCMGAIVAKPYSLLMQVGPIYLCFIVLFLCVWETLKEKLKTKN